MKSLKVKGAGLAGLSFLLLAGTGFWAKAGEAYRCQGYYGEVVVAFNSSGYSLRGLIKSGKSEAEQKECRGELRRQSTTFSYFTADKACPADYLRVENSLFEKGDGTLSLVNTSGGDTHDYSGYTYRVFKCRAE